MSDLLSKIPRRRRVLVNIIEDGSAKTFVYKDLDEDGKHSSRSLLQRLLQMRRMRKRKNS